MLVYVELLLFAMIKATKFIIMIVFVVKKSNQEINNKWNLETIK